MEMKQDKLTWIIWTNSVTFMNHKNLLTLWTMLLQKHLMIGVMKPWVTYLVKHFSHLKVESLYSINLQEQRWDCVSENLYKYFGIGFNTKRVPSENGFMIAIDRATRTHCLTIQDYQINHYGNPENIPEVIEGKIAWNTDRNHFPVTQTWTACKSILICSYSLSVKRIRSHRWKLWITY